VVEHCYRCQSDAPADAWSSDDWLVLLTRDGDLLGIACVGCVADQELVLAELEELELTA
jgi:hypothetical protein